MLVPDSHSLSAIKGTTYFSEETKKKVILNVSDLTMYIHSLLYYVCRKYLGMALYLKQMENYITKMVSTLVGRNIYFASEPLVSMCPDQENHG